MGIELEIVDSDDNPLEKNEEGLLRIRSPYMADGYDHDSGSADGHYKDGWFYPGDVGRLTGENRLLHVTGRENEILNIGGKKIAPHRLEQFATSQPGVKDAAAFAMPAKSGLDEVWLAVVAEQSVDFKNLNEKYVETFGPTVSPKMIIHVESIPRSESGKIRRPLLKELASQTKPAN